MIKHDMWVSPTSQNVILNVSSDRVKYDAFVKTYYENLLTILLTKFLV